MKMSNFLRSSKKGFQDSKRLNSSRKEPPVVSGTHEQHWDLGSGKSTKRKNFSQQNIYHQQRLARGICKSDTSKNENVKFFKVF